jgi:hypothetical protein
MLRFIALIALLLMLPLQVSSAPPREAAADALAAQGKLFCHRTLRATGWVNTNDGAYNNAAYREADQDTSDTSLCGFDSGGYRAVYSTIAVPTVGTGKNGLPAISVNGRFGLFAVHSKKGGAVPPGRMGVRYYRWWSPGNNFCQEGKYAQIQTYWSFSGSLGGGVIWGANAHQVPGSNTTDMMGRWYRWEIYVQPSVTSAQSETIYLKNITDAGASESTLTEPTTWTVSSFNDAIHHYYDRQNKSTETTCPAMYMYFIVAQNLGPNERIPPAIEIEGGSSDTTAPSTPTGGQLH